MVVGRRETAADRFRLLAILSSLCLLLTAFWSGDLALAAENGVEERMRKDITFLASDQCEGRGLTTRGINLAADYIADHLKAAGLKPGRGDGSYFQRFTVNGPGTLAEPNRVQLRGPLGQVINLKMGKQFQVVGLSGSAQATAPIVFAGFGITATGIAYDDYAPPVDMAGKIVVIVRKTPRFDNHLTPFDGGLATHHAALVTKMVNAELHKAAGVIFVSDRNLPEQGDALMPFSYTAGSSSSAKIPAVHVHRSVVDSMLQATAGANLADIEKDIDRDLKPRTFPLAGWKATIQATVKRQAIPVKNVVGVLEGAGPLGRETVIVGAHYDHLGYGGAGSLSRNRNGKEIHHGADDNGSGTTALLELARRLGKERNRQGRRLVFIAFTGEESGLLGSAYYCEHPLFPLADTVTMVNLDMVGRLRKEKNGTQDRLEVHGTGTSKSFATVIDELNRAANFKLDKQAGGLGPSDHASFYMKKMPVLFFFTGNHMDYHKPSDTADKINVVGMAKVTDLVEKLVRHLAVVTERPQYIAVKGGTMGGRGPQGPRLGIMPAYGEAQTEGVLIGGVSANGPADKAGLKEGDRIVELAGKPVRDIRVYMVIMATQKVGQEMTVGVLRDGKKLNFKVKPQ
jgi:hypothetical protein